MDNYILVAVGGSGARVAQSVVALAAAGLPAELGIDSNKDHAQLYIKLVDIDVNHNDGRELYEMIDSYNRAINEHYDEENDMFVDKDGGTLKWRPMPIKMCSQEEFIFDAQLGGAGARKESVEDLITGIQGDSRLLLDALLGKDDREMNLLAGCKARPRIGSLLWQWLYSEDSKKFWEDIRSKMVPGNNTHVMFVGSVFGGTGASGVPTLAKLLKKSVESVPHGDEKYGITLMTPYFQLTPPEDSLVQSNKFPFESKMAMGYYETDPELMSMDCIQIVGDRLRNMIDYNANTETWQPISYTEDESGLQNDPSMPAELAAAIGVHQFFADQNKDKVIVHKYEEEPVNELSAIHSVNMLPQPTETARCLNRLSRMCDMVLGYYDAFAQKKPHDRPTMFYNLWTSKQLKDPNWIDENWYNETYGVGAFITFASKIWRWLADLEHNEMRDVLRLDEEYNHVSFAAQKGTTKFDLYGKAGKDITGIINDETNQFFSKIQGVPEGKWAQKRQVAFIKTMLKACE